METVEGYGKGMYRVERAVIRESGASGERYGKR